MKFIVVALAIGFIAAAHGWTDKQKEDWAGFKKQCFESTGFSADVFASAKKTGNFPTDKLFKEFTVCVHKKSGFMNEKGEVQLDVIKKELTTAVGDEEATTIFKDCTKDLTGETEDVSFRLFKCVFDKTIKGKDTDKF